MKTFEKIGLALFSTLILIISIIMCLLVFGWLELDFAYEIMKRAINNELVQV